MNAGDVVTCRAPYGYALTIDKHYTVLEYLPKYLPDNDFMWPAYVRVVDDFGEEVWCYASRFTKEVAP